MEQLKNLRWPVVVASLLVTLGLLYGGNALVQARTQASPLRAFLQAQPAVATHSLELEGAGPRIRVELAPVDDLGTVYRTLEEETGRILGAVPAITVVDRRTPALTEAFYRINPLLQEALYTGRYGGLVEAVEARARSLDVDRTRVSIDGGRVFLQLHRGDDYLYAVLSLPPGSTSGQAAEGGWRR